jgi:hypothetical protein
MNRIVIMTVSVPDGAGNVTLRAGPYRIAVPPETKVWVWQDTWERPRVMNLRTALNRVRDAVQKDAKA